MASLADSLVSTADRRISIRRRPDLSAERQHYQGRSYWVVKDPVGLNYFRFQEEEYFILNVLHGRVSLNEIKQRFEAEFPPQKISLDEVQQFLGMLHQSGLVVADVPGQGAQLNERRGERRRKELLGAVSNVLCIRFRGFDPERFLAWLYPKTRWLFAPLTLVLAMMLVLAAFVLITVQFDVFLSKLPAFHDFFNFQNAIAMAATLAITKVIHEFGHGLTCKRFGGECHEMGVMILVLTPCLYCNVSDSWMLPSKWQRAAIGAAGMAVELLMASICTFVWWFTQPGPLNYMCMNVMFICSVSTILFNANPLLRYDGYYIMADLVEIPNLRQKASRILSRTLAHWFLGIQPPDDPFLPKQNKALFAAYSVAAVVYRWFILFSILFFLQKVFKPYGLEILGRIMVVVSLCGLVGMPLYQLGKYFHVPGRLEQVKRTRLTLTLAGVAALATAFFLVPLPHRVFCTLEIQPRDAASVYVTVPGQLEKIEKVLLEPGQPVEKGQPLARLVNREIDLSLAELDGQANRYRRQLESLLVQRHRDSQAGAQIPAVRESLRTVEDQLLRRQEDRRRLELVAPVAGTVFPPAATPSKPVNSDDDLPMWSGTPLEAKNLGCFLEEGQPFCQIGDPTRMDATLVIDQADIEFVLLAFEKAKKEGGRPLPVEIQLEAYPGRRFTHNQVDGKAVRLTISEISREDLKASPIGLSAKAGGDLATETDPSGREHPASTSYSASVAIDTPADLLLPGMRGQAKITVGSQPLAARFYRWLKRTVTFEL